MWEWLFGASIANSEMDQRDGGKVSAYGVLHLACGLNASQSRCVPKFPWYHAFSDIPALVQMHYVSQCLS